ncbi:MAG: LytTR family DNA-binding domain-containing protein [Ginsengibacter sp.]
MKVVIIEDEKPAVDNIIHCLNNTNTTVTIVQTLSSVAASVKWFSENASPDLVFMDIQLSDGLSFNIFKNCSVECPVIFITAYEKYLIEAFEYNSIDYLLKPIDQLKFNNSIKKYNQLKTHFVNNHASLLEYLNNQNNKKTRIVVRKGVEFITIRVEEIVYFFSEHKIVFLVDKERKKYMVEKKSLAEMQEELDQKLFFRANRKFIVNANYISNFKTIENSKILITLTVPLNEQLVVSQENAPVFKKWISEL